MNKRETGGEQLVLLRLDRIFPIIRTNWITTAKTRSATFSPPAHHRKMSMKAKAMIHLQPLYFPIHKMYKKQSICKKKHAYSILLPMKTTGTKRHFVRRIWTCIIVFISCSILIEYPMSKEGKVRRRKTRKTFSYRNRGVFSSLKPPC